MNANKHWIKKADERGEVKVRHGEAPSTSIGRNSEAPVLYAPSSLKDICILPCAQVHIVPMGRKHKKTRLLYALVRQYGWGSHKKGAE